MAQKSGKAAVFIDEIDVFLSNQFSGGDAFFECCTQELLLQLQEIRDRNHRVLFMAASCKPQKLCPMIRECFQQMIEIGLPNWLVRQKHLMVCFSGIGNNITEQDILSLEIITEGYSLSDLSIVCKESIMMPIRDLQNTTHFIKLDGKICQCSASTSGAF